LRGDAIPGADSRGGKYPTTKEVMPKIRRRELRITIRANFTPLSSPLIVGQFTHLAASFMP